MDGKRLLIKMAHGLLTSDSGVVRACVVELARGWGGLPAHQRGLFLEDFRWRVLRMCEGRFPLGEIRLLESVPTAAEPPVWRGMFSRHELRDLQRPGLLGRILEFVLVDLLLGVPRSQSAFLRQYEGNTFLYYTPKRRILRFIQETLVPKLGSEVIPLFACHPRLQDRQLDIDMLQRLFRPRLRRFGAPLLAHIQAGECYLHPCSNQIHLAARRPEFTDKLLAYIGSVAHRQEVSPMMSLLHEAAADHRKDVSSPIPEP